MTQRDVIMHPIVAGVVVKRDGKYLLVQEAQQKAYKLWNFPAGRVDVGDTIEQTAIKEAKEESGFDVRLIRKIGIFQPSERESPKHAFEAEIIGGKLHFPPDEIMDARWFTFDEIKELQRHGELRNNWVVEAITILENSH